MNRTTSLRISTLVIGLLMVSTIGANAQDETASTSGYDFERLAPLTDNERSELRGVAELATGVIGVVGGERPGGGDDGWTPLSWASSDGGQTWTQGGFDEGVDDVIKIVALGDEFVTVGVTTDGGTTPTSSVLTSPDGLEWTVVATLEDVGPGRLLVTPDGLAMLGLEFREADGWGTTMAGYPSLFKSTDGVIWDTHEITAPIYGQDDEDIRGLGRLAHADDGSWLATGPYFDPETETTRFLVHYSIDGVDWTEATAPIAETDGFGTLVSTVWTGSGFLVSAFTDGSDASPAGLFLTTDGSEWEHVADIPAPDLPTITSDGKVTIGFRLPFAEGEGQPSLADGSPIYVSDDGRTWEHPTPFLLEQGHANDAVITADGRVLVVGADISNCREFFCVFNPDNGTVPTAWMGTPRQ